MLVEVYDETPNFDDDLSSDEEEEEIEEVIPDVIRNEIEIPVFATVETIMIEDNVGETIVIDDSQQEKIDELTATIARLREDLVESNSAFEKVDATLRQVRSRQNNISFSKQPAMSNVTYVRGLGNGFLSTFKRTKSRKKKKAMASEFFKALEDDPDMKEQMLT